MGPANSKLNTYWSQLRVERNVTIPVLCSETGLSEGALVTYFSGEHVPREYAARKLCYYFGVDYDFGLSKFIEGHKIWNERHSEEWHKHDKQRESTYAKNYYRENVYMTCLPLSRNSDADIIEKLNTIEVGNRSSYIRWVLRQHLRNDTFSTERLTPEVQALLKVIYSEVPFEIFMQMLSTLLDSKKIDAKLLYGYVSYPTFLEISKLQNYI